MCTGSETHSFSHRKSSKSSEHILGMKRANFSKKKIIFSRAQSSIFLMLAAVTWYCSNQDREYLYY